MLKISTFRRNEFSTVRGLNSEETSTFDLRTINTINWCTDTLDGACDPADGTWYRAILGVSRDTLVTIATRYRTYVNQSCEQKGWFGNQALAETLSEQSRLYQELISLLRSLRGRQPGVTTSLRLDQNSSPMAQQDDLRFLKLFLEHPNYLHLLEAVAHEGYVELTFDAETFTWMATLSEPETPSLT